LVADEPVRLRLLKEEVREDYLQIYETASRKLITGIEFVSPSNKAEVEARELYLRKRRELWKAHVNMVEVDLLRGGKPVVRLPRSLLRSIRARGYVVNVMRVGSREYEFYPIDLRAHLPRVGIPLKPGEPDAVLDLQAALARVYEQGAYELRIDYIHEPVPRLEPETERWADKLLIEAGLRSRLEPAGPINGPETPTE
jgi:hypothetical protein